MYVMLGHVRQRGATQTHAFCFLYQSHTLALELLTVTLFEVQHRGHFDQFG
jgi:hypothetical protein